MRYSPVSCSQTQCFLPLITNGAIRLVVVLSLLGLTALAEASTPAMATVEFFQDDTLEAAIDVVSVLPGEQGNGLAIAFSTEALGGANPSSNVIGNAGTGYTIQINNDTSTIPYDQILQSLDSITEVSASLRSSVVGSVFEPDLQDIPPTTFLSGGVNAMVPEPQSAILAAMVCGILGTNRRR